MPGQPYQRQETFHSFVQTATVHYTDGITQRAEEFIIPPRIVPSTTAVEIGKNFVENLETYMTRVPLKTFMTSLPMVLMIILSLDSASSCVLFRYALWV